MRGSGRAPGQDKQPPPPPIPKDATAILSWTPSQGPSLVLRSAACKLWARPTRPWRSAAVGPKRPGHDRTMTSGQNSSFGFVSTQVPTSIASSKPKAGKRSTGELKSREVVRYPDKRHSLGAARSVRQVPRAGFCLRQFSVGWGGTAGSWEGVRTIHLGARPSPGARAPTLPSGPSPGCGLGSAHPQQKQKVGLAVHAPDT